jgi:hypothetical protein
LVSGLGSLSPAPNEIYSRKKKFKINSSSVWRHSLWPSSLSFFTYQSNRNFLIFSLANLQTTFLTTTTKAISDSSLWRFSLLENKPTENVILRQTRIEPMSSPNQNQLKNSIAQVWKSNNNVVRKEE